MLAIRWHGALLCSLLGPLRGGSSQGLEEQSKWDLGKSHFRICHHMA